MGVAMPHAHRVCTAWDQQALLEDGAMVSGVRAMKHRRHCDGGVRGASAHEALLHCHVEGSGLQANRAAQDLPELLEDGVAVLRDKPLPDLDEGMEIRLRDASVGLAASACRRNAAELGACLCLGHGLFPPPRPQPPWRDAAKHRRRPPSAERDLRQRCLTPRPFEFSCGARRAAATPQPWWQRRRVRIAAVAAEARARLALASAGLRLRKPIEELGCGGERRSCNLLLGQVVIVMPSHIVPAAACARERLHLLAQAEHDAMTAQKLLHPSEGRALPPSSLLTLRHPPAATHRPGEGRPAPCALAAAVAAQALAAPMAHRPSAAILQARRGIRVVEIRHPLLHARECM
mmetsp:Transcript_133029/g.384769  ORF Transcript_133029/g.384769 Transcript_133029/m.384769 type:complete len:348 (+) Transcript_133029:663-1706(+)